jgi:hypothetical protein
VNDLTIGFCAIDTSVAVQYGQTIVIGVGVLIALAFIALWRIWTSDRKYKDDNDRT